MRRSTAGIAAAVGVLAGCTASPPPETQRLVHRAERQISRTIQRKLDEQINPESSHRRQSRRSRSDGYTDGSAAYDTPATGHFRTSPDSSLTPGDLMQGVTLADICEPGYSRSVRNVPVEVKRQAYSRYGIGHHQPGQFEVDHLIPLELGGSNSIRNLWPEPGSGPWNYHKKDRLETRLHQMACNDEIALRTAQHEISTDWVSAYKRYMGGGPSRRMGGTE